MDFERLREDLKDYFGTAMQFNPAAIIELSIVENASYDKLIDIAISNNFNLDDYKIRRR